MGRRSSDLRMLFFFLLLSVTTLLLCVFLLLSGSATCIPSFFFFFSQSQTLRLSFLLVYISDMSLDSRTFFITVSILVKSLVKM